MKWIFRSIGALVVLVIAAVALLFLLPAEKIAKLVSDQFEAATGRAMMLEGDVRPTLWPDLGVTTGAVRIANADWAGDTAMIAADRLSIGVDMMALLSGDVRVKQVEIEAPRIALEIGADGRGNWEFGLSNAEIAEPSDGGLPEFSLERAAISGGSISFVDRGTGSDLKLTGIDAVVKLPDLAGAAALQVTAAMNGQGFELDTTVFNLLDFLSAETSTITADFSTGASTASFKGRAGLQPLAATGDLVADLQDMAALYRLLGLAAPEVPKGFGQTIGLRGNVTVTDGIRLALRDGLIRLDQNVLLGGVDVVLAEPPRITAQLRAEGLDFSALTGGGPADEGAASAGWSRDRIDVSALQAVDAEVALVAQSLDLGLAQLGRTSVLTTLESGRAVTEIREMAAYGGALAGEVIVNSRGGLSARTDLRGDGVALQPLLQDLAGFDRLLAVGDVAVNLLLVGDDMHSLMNSMSGDGRVSLGQGELRGLDLAGMVRTLDVGHVGEGAKTIFDSVSGSFTVDGGELRNDDLQMQANLLTATGAGRLGIGAQDIEFRVVPTLLEGQTGGIKVPLLISGPWSALRYQLDLKALAEQELADEVEEVKARVEEAVTDKLNDELGIEVEKLNEVEDALKNELENRVREGLFDLLKAD